MKSILLIIFLTILPGSVFAEDVSYSEKFNECMKSSEGVTVSMRACYSDEIDSQDNRLNINYRNYISPMSADIKKNFVNAQRAWVKFRDENCKAFQSQEAGGTLSLITGDSCYLRMTTERADDFKKRQ